MRHACKHPHRQGPSLRAAIDYLRRLGAEAVAVLHGHKLIRVTFRYRGQDFGISLGHSSRTAAAQPIWAIRAQLRKAGLPAPALA